MANTKQGNLSFAQYFLKIKNLYSKITLLDQEEPISKAQLKRYIFHGLKPEYIPYVTSIQGWAQQPSLEEFENLLSSQVSLGQQMAGVTVKDDEESALLARKKTNLKGNEKKKETAETSEVTSKISKNHNQTFKCYR